MQDDQDRSEIAEGVEEPHVERGTVAEMLSAALRATRTSKSEAARLCGKTKQYVGFVANGKADPKADTLAKILAAAGYEIAFVPKGAPLPDGSMVVETQLPSYDETEFARVLAEITPFERQQRERLMVDWMRPLDATPCPKCGAPMWVRPGILDETTCMLNCARCGHEEGRANLKAPARPFTHRVRAGWLPGDDLEDVSARSRQARERAR